MATDQSASSPLNNAVTEIVAAVKDQRSIRESLFAIPDKLAAICAPLVEVHPRATREGETAWIQLVDRNEICLASDGRFSVNGDTCTGFAELYQVLKPPFPDSPPEYSFLNANEEDFLLMQSIITSMVLTFATICNGQRAIEQWFLSQLLAQFTSGAALIAGQPLSS